jgi:hypothetical protein
MSGYYTNASGNTSGFAYDGTNFQDVSFGSDTILTYTGLNDQAGDLGGLACLNPGSGFSVGVDWSGYISVWGSTSTTVFGENASNQVVGAYTDSQNHVHGFDYNLLPLDPPGAIKSYATGINDLGDIVGLWVTSDGKQHGYVTGDDGHSFTQIDVPGATSTIARGLDAGTMTVGGYQDAAGVRHGFAWNGSTFATIDVPGAIATTAYGVQNSTIVGSYVDASNRTHGFVLDGFVMTSSGTTSSSPGSLAVSGFPSSTTAGMPGNFTVTVHNSNGTVDTGYTGTVHFTSSDPKAVLPADYTFTAADAGVHTFSATLKTAGTQSVTATDVATAGLAGSETGISVNPAAASQLVLGQQPSTTTSGQAISPAVTVYVEDQYGNVVTSDSSTVTVTLTSGTFEGGSATASATASGGWRPSVPSRSTRRAATR